MGAKNKGGLSIPSSLMFLMLKVQKATNLGACKTLLHCNFEERIFVVTFNIGFYT